MDEEQRKREQTTAQMNAIASEIRAKQPLTSDMYPISHLVDFYLTDGSTEPNFFLQGACYLSHKYKSYRCVRGDGNCYYRAFLYALCEGLLQRLKAKEEGAMEEIQRLQRFGMSIFWKMGNKMYNLQVSASPGVLILFFSNLIINPTLKNMKCSQGILSCRHYHLWV